MKTLKIVNIIFLFALVLAATVHTRAQGSPDSRLCNCFAEPIPDKFMHGVKAVYGTIGIYLSPNLELPPQQLQPVKFTVPVIKSKQGCRSWYSIYVADERNNKVFESAGENNEMSYAFPDCDKTYTVVLMAYSKSAGGGDGNCSRRITITVKPKCNTANCPCSAKGISAPFTLTGELKCKGLAGSENRYLLQYSITNKSDCILAIQSITVLNQLVEAPLSRLAPKSSLTGISLGFSTPASAQAPADTKISAIVRYSLNGRKCTETIHLPFRRCN